MSVSLFGWHALDVEEQIMVEIAVGESSVTLPHPPSTFIRCVQ